MSIDVTVTHLSGSRSNQVETHRGLPLWFGRSQKCQVRFDPEQERKVSALHCELRKTEEGGVLVIDLDSRNGVVVNGIKVEGQADVPNHAILELGVGGPRLRLTFEDGGGVNFSRVRRKTENLKKDKGFDRLATTDESFPAYVPEEDDGSVGKQDQGTLLMAVFGGMFVLGLVLIIIVIATG